MSFIGAKIDLSEGLTVDRVRDLLASKPELENRLGAHLPPRDPEDRPVTTSDDVVANIQSPQFKSALKVSSCYSTPENYLLVTWDGIHLGAVVPASMATTASRYRSMTTPGSSDVGHRPAVRQEARGPSCLSPTRSSVALPGVSTRSVVA